MAKRAKKEQQIEKMKVAREKTLARKRKNTAQKILDAKTVEVVQNRYEIVKRRRDGESLQSIAIDLNMSVQQVSLELKSVLVTYVEETQETVEESRALQDMRLDELIRTYLPLATQSHKERAVDRLTGQEVIVTVPPDPKCAGVVLATETRRAKLLGIDKPEPKGAEGETGIRVYVGVNMDKV